MALTERPYQLEANRALWRSMFIENNHRVMLQAGTGMGKTVIGSFFIQRYRQFQKRPVLFLAHRREIVDQTVRKLREAGLSCGTIMAERPFEPWKDIQVGSVDTLDAWVGRGKIGLPEAGLLIIDEAHRAMGKRYQDLIEIYVEDNGAYLLGMTATPIRSDGVGFARSFDDMYCCPGIQWAIDHNYLVPVQYKVGIIPDLKGVKLTAGDYNQAQLEAVMDQRLLIGDVVDNWQAWGENRPTMAFCAGVKHSQHLVGEFMERGIRAEHIDANTPLTQRDGLSERLLTGETQVVCNAQVYVEGTDIPWIGCVILAKPTKSVGRYLQEAGRGLRPWLETGKRDLILLDHAGNVNKHGRVERDRQWILTEGKEMEEQMRSETEKQKVEFTCPDCHTLFTGLSCPVCSRPVEFKGRAANFIPAELVDLTQAEFDLLMKPGSRVGPAIERRDFYAQLMAYAQAKGWSNGWAYHKYIDRYKEKPERAWRDLEPKPVTKEVRTWINGQIANAKIREKIQEQRKL